MMKMNIDYYIKIIEEEFEDIQGMIEYHQKHIDDLRDKIKHHYNEIYNYECQKEILEKKSIDLEAKNMSLVINTLFFFNTLKCTARIAYFEESHTTEELIYCLSDLLRYNLKQEDQLHTIASEIENIEKYLYPFSKSYKKIYAQVSSPLG